MAARQQPGPSHDSVERRAQLVREGREELVFRPVRRLRLEACLMLAFQELPALLLALMERDGVAGCAPAVPPTMRSCSCSRRRGFRAPPLLRHPARQRDHWQRHSRVVQLAQLLDPVRMADGSRAGCSRMPRCAPQPAQPSARRTRGSPHRCPPAKEALTDSRSTSSSSTRRMRRGFMAVVQEARRGPCLFSAAIVREV